MRARLLATSLTLSAGLTLTAGSLGLSTPALAATPLSIATVQGTAKYSAYQGKVVTLAPSVVTAVYSNAGSGLRGFVIQTPGTGGPDRNLKKASDAIFVYTGSKASGVAIGELVTVSGTVDEYPGSTDPSVDSLTEIGGTVTVTVSSARHAAVRPVTGLSWADTYAHRENLESMLYRTPEKFVVADNYPLLHYGELGLAAGGALPVQPTDVAPYGSKKAERQARLNAVNSVSLDDGSNQSFFASKANPAGGTVPYLTPSHDVKVGDTAKLNAPVIVDYRNGGWTFEPTRPVDAGHEIATITEKAHEATPKVGGRLSIASFNVLNYFPTTGQGQPGCTGRNLDTSGSYNVTYDCDLRGAWDQADFLRQQAKIVTAINQLDASVTGLMEIENSAKVGQPTDSAVQTLVAALNQAAGFSKWAWVPSSTQLQPVADQDVINNAIIYQPARAALIGDAYADGADASDDGAFANARTPIGASFAPRAGGADTLVVVNHFKSKGSAPSNADDPNADHGQGAWNAQRVEQAKALLAWVPTVQRATGDQAVALIGDFNSYSNEDPLRTLASAGYRNAAAETDYSYSYSGLAGSLDHVLLNRAAAKELTKSAVWNINSIESDAHEYSEYEVTALDYYTADQYRASDHDPVIVGLDVPKS